MNRTHHGQHGADCFGCKLQSIQFGNVEAPPQRLMERRWDRDLAAYRRLRKQGLQPARTKGCAELEAVASSQLEIDLHMRIDRHALAETMPRIQEGMALAKESGWNPVDTHRSGSPS